MDGAWGLGEVAQGPSSLLSPSLHSCRVGKRDESAPCGRPAIWGRQVLHETWSGETVEGYKRRPVPFMDPE